MLILAGTVLAIALVPVLGGRIGALASLHLRQGWLIGIALVLQVICISVVPTWPRVPLIAMHVTSYVIAAVFTWRNRHLPGLALLALGGALNAVTIGLNHGTLPASRSALVRAGLPISQDKFLNSGVVQHPHLAFFGDNYPSPGWLPLHNVYSIGDGLILCGVAWLVHRTCNSVISRNPATAMAEYRALTSVRIEEHLDALDLLDEARAERDDAVEALEEMRQRNIALVRLLSVPAPEDSRLQALN